MARSIENEDCMAENNCIPVPPRIFQSPTELSHCSALSKDDDKFWIPAKLRALTNARDRASKLAAVFSPDLESGDSVLINNQ